jgi:hypothetical protein
MSSPPIVAVTARRASGGVRSASSPAQATVTRSAVAEETNVPAVSIRGTTRRLKARRLSPWVAWDQPRIYGRLVTIGHDLSEVDPFTPKRPVSRRRFVVRVLIAPFLWLIAFVVAAIVVRHTNAIGIGLAVAFGSMLIAVLVLTLIRAARDRERRRYAERG